MQLAMSFIVNEPLQSTSNYFEIRSKAALAKLSSINENITRTCVYRKLPPWESKLLRFCWGAISLAHANADDLVIPIKARPNGNLLSRFSCDHYERLFAQK